MPWPYVIGAPLVAAALVWLYHEQKQANVPAWERAATGAVCFTLAMAVGVWLR
jgi:hypothetical protein